ncbi:SDR family NAD(P)-dependent oxidoreductase [Streptomyces lydicus]
MPLPTHPFNHQHHWLTHPTPHTPPKDAGPHTLLDKTLLRTMGQSVFLTGFTAKRHWILDEHRLLGDCLVPGTTYLEMARAAAAEHFSQVVTEIRDVVFFSPLLVEEKEGYREAHTTIRETGDGTAEFTVASQPTPDAPWTLHARGTVSVVPLPEPVTPRDPDALRARCGLDAVDVAALLAEHPWMRFGGRWLDGMDIVRIGERAALGALHLPEEYQSECEDLPLHPAILDLATGFSGYAVAQNARERAAVRADRGFFLPVGYESLRIHAPLPAQGLSYIESPPEYENSREVRKVDVVVCDESGTVAVEIRGFTLKRVTDPHGTVARSRTHARHHVLRWVPVPALPAVRSVPAHHHVLLVGERAGLADGIASELLSLGVEVTQAVLSDSPGADADSDVHAVPPTEDGIARLLEVLGTRPPDELVYLAESPEEAVGNEVSALDRHLRTRVEAFFSLLKGLTEQDALPARLSVVAPSVAQVSGREESTAPVHAMLFATARVVGLENDGVDVLCIDTAPGTAAEAVCAELFGPRTPSTVALREGRRHVAELVSVNLSPQGRARPAPPRPEGVYLITGGLGGLGLEIARYLSERVPGIRLALMGRGELPSPDRWDEVPASDARGQAQIGILRELARNGAVVRTYAADVCDPEAVSMVVSAVRHDLGTIGCIVHAAGVAGDGFLFRKDAGTFRQTLAPKVLGAVALDRATADAPPELMVNFGSTAAVFGTAGQSDYAAANSYLDHFAEHRSTRGLRTVTIDWSSWIGTGMADDHGLPQDQGFFRSLSVEDGVLSFDEILGAPYSRVIVGEINRQRIAGPNGADLVDLLSRGPLRLAESVPTVLPAAAPTASVGEPLQETAAVPQGRESGVYSATEQGLVEVVAEDFGLDRLNVHENFFDLGVDSLRALRLAQRIEKQLHLRVAMVDLFRHVTVAELAEHLDTKHDPS